MRCSKQIWDHCDFCILPKALKTVEVACLGLEDMYQNVAIVHSDPESILETHYALLLLFAMIFDIVRKIVGYAVDMGRRCAFTHYEILEGRLFDVAHVDYLNVSGLAVLKTLDYSID